MSRQHQLPHREGRDRRRGERVGRHAGVEVLEEAAVVWHLALVAGRLARRQSHLRREHRRRRRRQPRRQRRLSAGGRERVRVEALLGAALRHLPRPHGADPAAAHGGLRQHLRLHEAPEALHVAQEPVRGLHLCHGPGGRGDGGLSGPGHVPAAHWRTRRKFDWVEGERDVGGYGYTWSPKGPLDAIVARAEEREEKGLFFKQKQGQRWQDALKNDMDDDPDDQSCLICSL